MRRGAATALAGIVLILVALTFETSELFIPGVALLILGATLPPWIWLAARTTSVSRRLEADTVLEDQPFETRIDLRRGPLGAPGGEIHDPLAGGRIALAGAVVAPGRGGTVEVRVVARFARRGRRRLDPPVLSLRDPLGMVRVLRPGGGEAQSLLVLPRVEAPQSAQREPGEPLGGQPGPLASEALAAVELDGLRPYRPGTPASRISWPALARGAGLLERRMLAEREAGPLVVLDARGERESEAVDAAVRAAASLTRELARRGGCELLLPGERRPLAVDAELAAWPAAHIRLALVEGGPDAPAPSLAPRPRSGPIFYVCAQAERLPAQLIRGAHRGAVLVLPLELTPPVRRPARFTVSGCAAYPLSPGGRLSPARERAA